MFDRLTTSWVRIDGGPFLERARAYRAEVFRCEEAWSAFGESRGATGYFRNASGLCFMRGAPPEGWSKPNRKNGYAAPKKGHPDVDALAALPRFPRSSDVFGDAIVTNLSYDMPCGGYGTGGIGFMFDGPDIGWAEDVFAARIPDARLAREAHLRDSPGDTIREPAASWKLPAGLVYITDAERDLLFAEAAVRIERRVREPVDA